jgi:aryl-alcohol dehydrogenase-like predicted oxidoreductase
VPRASSPLKHTGNLAPSRVIKGCWQLSGGHRGDAATDRTSGTAAVEDFAPFVAAGVTTFDTGPEACGYGPSELVIGEALRKGFVRRDEVQLFTKMCCVGREQSNMTSDWVNQKLDLPKRRLGVDTLDLVQMYWNDYGQKRYVDAALFLTEAKHAGSIGAVGLTNFDTKRMAEMIDAGAEISSNQIQFSLLDRRPERVMVEYCEKNGVALLPYGVVAGGLLSDAFLSLPGEDVVLDTSSKRKYASVLGYAGGYAWFQSLLGALRAIGDKHGGVSVANVAARWTLQSPVVPAVILGARNARHVDDHRALFSFELDDSDLARIRDVLDRGKKPKEDCYQWERGGGW